MDPRQQIPVLMNWRWTISTSPSRRNLARYCNHSCKPNAEADTVRGRLMYRALKRIPTGAQITIHYGEEYVELFLAKSEYMLTSK